jgi:ABC-type nitrate/sulfonate/bicarbonate transport system ATPase subunit
MSAISVRNVSKVYAAAHGDVVALENVSLEMPSGSFSCLVGGSGCGKSTLLDLIGGLNQPSEGAVEVGGRPVDGAGPDRGMVFQTYTLYPWLHVRENVQFGPSLRGLPKDEQRAIADRLLGEMGLTAFADAYPHELSGGMQQRVAIARAMANDPEVLLMDEPFGALDALTRSSAQRFLMDVWERNRRTIAFVTHDIEEAVFMADRVFVMSPRPGRVRELIEIDLPRPRTPELHTLPEFARYKARILELIHEVETPAGAAA